MRAARDRIRRHGCAILLTAFIAAACGSDDGSPGPSPSPLTLSLPNAAEGRFVSCASCQEPTVTVVIEIPVVIADPLGPGGSLERLETTVVNRTRGGEIARNVRPNSDHAFPDVTIPRGGQLVVEAGVVFPPPPPRDEVMVGVFVRLTDGRTATASAPLVVRAAQPP